MEIRLLGGIGAASGGRELELGGPKQRLILALLTLEARNVVSLDRIIEAVWSDDAPERAEVSVRGYVSNLRRLLARHEPAVVVQWREFGYVLTGPIDVDLVRFEQLVERGRGHAASNRLVEAKAILGAALDLWRGPPLGAHVGVVGFGEMLARWEEMRSDAIERLLEVRLALGEHREAVADLRAAVAEFPFREHVSVLLATALYRSDRPVEALRSIQAARRVMIDEVGVEPGPELRAVETKIHAEDPSLDWVEPLVGDVEGIAITDIGEPVAQASPLWGRTSELAVLRAALDDVRRGGRPNAGRAVIIGGEAGIGKTAIVERLAAHARTDGFIVVWGRCRESTTGAPYWPWHSIAGDLGAHSTTGDAGAALIDALDTAGEVPDSVPDSSLSQLATQSAVSDALAHLPRPCLLVVDDLQWGDAASLSLLEFIANDLSDLRLVVAVTVRSGTAGPAIGSCLAELSRSSGSRRVELVGLGRADVDEWVRDALGTPASADVAALIHQRTDGNPFFVREVLALLGANAAQRPIEKAAALDLPVAVHDVVRRRTSRLDPETQQLLLVASVLGRDVEIDLLAQVTATPQTRVMQLLEPAVEAGLIDVDLSRPGVARFSHGLVVDALVAELNPIRRARTHLEIVHAIEHRRAGKLEAVLPQLAFHAFAGASAGGVASALDYSLQAAEAASTVHAYQDAVTHLERAIMLLDVDSPSDNGRRITILTDLGLAQCAAADVSGGRTTLLAAATLAEMVGDIADVVRALAVVNADDLWTSLDWGQHDPAAIAIIERSLDVLGAENVRGRASLLGALAGQTYHVDPVRSSEAAAAAVATAGLIDDHVLHFRVLLQQYWAEWRPGGNAIRAAIADRMLGLVDRPGLPPGSASLAHLARFTAAYEIGDATASDRHLRLARAAADPFRTPAAWSYVLYAQASTELLRGDFESAEHTIDDLYAALWRSRRFVAETTRAGLRLQLRVEQGRTDDALTEIAVLESTIYASPLAWFRAWALAEGGRTEEVDRSLAAFDGEIADDWFKVPLLTAGVSAAAASGSVDFVRRHVDELRPFSRLLACTGSGGIVVGPVSLALASASRVLGDDSAAADYLRTARDMAERMGAAPWAARFPTPSAR